LGHHTPHSRFVFDGSGGLANPLLPFAFCVPWKGKVHQHLSRSMRQRIHRCLSPHEQEQRAPASTATVDGSPPLSWVADNQHDVGVQTPSPPLAPYRYSTPSSPSPMMPWQESLQLHPCHSTATSLANMMALPTARHGFTLPQAGTDIDLIPADLAWKNYIPDPCLAYLGASEWSIHQPPLVWTWHSIRVESPPAPLTFAFRVQW